MAKLNFQNPLLNSFEIIDLINDLVLNILIINVENTHFQDYLMNRNSK